MTKHVYANASLVARENGMRIDLHVDDAWDADDPFVKARPDLFSDEPTKVNRTTPPVDAPVEQATAAPGEKRTTKRTAKRG